jgi:hypothetical protein
MGKRRLIDRQSPPMEIAKSDRDHQILVQQSGSESYAKPGGLYTFKSMSHGPLWSKLSAIVVKTCPFHHVLNFPLDNFRRMLRHPC